MVSEPRDPQAKVWRGVSAVLKVLSIPGTDLFVCNASVHSTLRGEPPHSFKILHALGTPLPPLTQAIECAHRVTRRKTAFLLGRLKTASPGPLRADESDHFVFQVRYFFFDQRKNSVLGQIDLARLDPQCCRDF